MKIISTLLLCSFLPFYLWATTSTFSGSYIVGYDNQLKILKTKKIAITIPDTVEKSDAITSVIVDLSIEGEDLFPARFTDGKATVYVRTPQEFSYYRLDLNPPKEAYSNTSRVVANKMNGSTVFCNEGTTALLTAFRGDGSSANFCTKIAP